MLVIWCSENSIATPCTTVFHSSYFRAKKCQVELCTRQTYLPQVMCIGRHAVNTISSFLWQITLTFSIDNPNLNALPVKCLLQMK